MSFKIFLINLDRSADRLARCKPILDELNLPWERVAGVDGFKLDSEFVKRLNPEPCPHNEWFRTLSPGEIGCFLSHLKCWQLVVKQNIDCALILEDDFAFTPAFRKDTLSKLESIHTQWDLIRMTRLGARAVPTIRVDEHSALHTESRGPTDCSSYMVSLGGAKKLITDREHLYRPVTYDLKHYWERDLKVFAMGPSFFHQQSHEEAPSVIGIRTGYRNYPLAKRTLLYLRKYRYHINFWLADRAKIGQRPLRSIADSEPSISRTTV